MNMRFTLPDDLELVQLSTFQRPAAKPPFDRTRIVGLGLTVALHIAIVAAVIYGGAKVMDAIAPPPIMVTLEEVKPDQPHDPPKPVPLVRPQTETAPMPEIDIASEAPPPIQTQVTLTPPAPPVAVSPPLPVATAPAETQQSYLAKLLAYLNRYKRYPAGAKAARITGVVMLHFVMDKTGHVQSCEIARSSGRPALDEEALALIQRAQPLPAIPDGFGKDNINAIVPIEFSLH